MAHPRPLSPHLSIYRWRVNMLQSTLHRLSGLLLCVGALLVAWALIAAASGPSAWAIFAGFWGSWFGLALLFIWTLALIFHLCNGIQHLVHDSARNFGPPTRDRRFNPVYWSTGWMVIGVSVALTVVIWGFLIARMGGASA